MQGVGELTKSNHSKTVKGFYFWKLNPDILFLIRIFVQGDLLFLQSAHGWISELHDAY
jgi:hypothetical protein